MSNFSINIDDDILVNRVKIVMGVPSEFLDSDSVISPEIKKKAEKYIGKRLEGIKEEIKEEYDKVNVEIAYVYYIAYLISPTMPIRLPQRMENISTKTLLQTIDWDAFGNEMLKRCDDTLDNLLEEFGAEATYGTTLVGLSDTAPYPNELV